MRDTIIVLMLTSLLMNSLTPNIQPDYLKNNMSRQDSEISNHARIMSRLNSDQISDTGLTPETSLPGTPEPSQSETAQPETAQPETAQPETAQPETAQPTTSEIPASPGPTPITSESPQPTETPGAESSQVPENTGVNTDIQNGLDSELADVPKPVEPDIRAITLSFAGDCTIGDDDKYSWNTFDSIYKKVNDPGYFFRGVKDVFTKDDFTFVNFEGTFTTAIKKAIKEYRFKGDPTYISVLKQGSIEGVSLANNHSMDYLDQGFNDTVAALNNAGISWVYFEKNFIADIKGLKIGFLGYKGWENESRSDNLLVNQVKAMRLQGVSFIVANYHWGDQNSYTPNALQKRMAHFAIDNGVDLVIGHHPHVLQGKEIYKGKPILYSLGNFCFGGAPNPGDKDTIIYQIVINYDATARNILSTVDKIIPARVSSEISRNDYRPVLVLGDEGKRILDKFERISKLIK